MVVKCMLRHYKAVRMQAKKGYHEEKTMALLMLMRTNPSLAMKGLSPTPTRSVPPVTNTQWEGYLDRHFRGGAQPTDAPHAGSQGAHEARQRAASFVVPSIQDLVGSIKRALDRMDVKSASGLDAVPVTFIRGAVAPGPDGVPTNVLTPLLASWFHALMLASQHTGVMLPAAWRGARIAPVFKKGNQMDPESYRMIAVSSVLYRLFASCTHDLTTSWCEKVGGVIPDTQFGFVHARNAQQAQFLLRHVVQSRRRVMGRGKGKNKVWSAFIDFKQAYDHVDRGLMMAHLEHSVGVPAFLCHVVHAMYTGDTNQVVSAGQSTNPVAPSKGVRQGCPLSPLLFALFINDLPAALTSGEPDDPAGVRLGCRTDRLPVQWLSHLLYADDLTLLESSKARLQSLLDRLAVYSKRKGLTVNVAKCAVMVFKGDDGDGQGLSYQGRDLPVVSEFKFLGTWFDEKCNMKAAAERQTAAVWAAWWQAKSWADEKGLTAFPHVMRQVVLSYVLPAALYGCQVWGPDVLRADVNHRSAMGHPVQAAMCQIFKKVLHVSPRAPSWCVLDEMSARMVHFYWFRACANFWNSVVASTNPLLVSVVKAEWLLSQNRHDGMVAWLSKFNGLLHDLHVPVAHCVSAGADGAPSAGDVGVWMSAWESNAAQIRAGCSAADPRDPACPHRTQSTYVQWFRTAPPTHHPCLPQYLSAGTTLPHKVVCDMARFRLSSHALAVQAGRAQQVSYENRRCSRCDMRVVDDEAHFLLECRATAPVRALPKFACLHLHVPPAQARVSPPPVQARIASLFRHSDGCLVAQFVSECMALIEPPDT